MKNLTKITLAATLVGTLLTFNTLSASTLPVGINPVGSAIGVGILPKPSGVFPNISKTIIGGPEVPTLPETLKALYPIEKEPGTTPPTIPLPSGGSTEWCVGISGDVSTAWCVGISG